MNPAFLLDTCACIFIVEGKLRPETVRLLTEYYRRGEAIYISPYSAWELAMLASKARVRLPMSVDDTFEMLITRPGFALAPITPAVLIESCRLPDAARLRDPADRIIAATARTYGYTVLTRDRPLLEYAAEGHLSALAC